MNGGNDDGDVFVGKGGLGGNRLGLVNPVADAVDDEAEVAMNPRRPV